MKISWKIVACCCRWTYAFLCIKETDPQMSQCVVRKSHTHIYIKYTLIYIAQTVQMPEWTSIWPVQCHTFTQLFVFTSYRENISLTARDQSKPSKQFIIGSQDSKNWTYTYMNSLNQRVNKQTKTKDKVKDREGEKDKWKR